MSTDAKHTPGACLECGAGVDQRHKMSCDSRGRPVASLLLAENSRLRAELERVKGIRPEFPSMPPNGAGLPRYGLRWNGPQQPVAVPMPDGYWTPAHLAESIRAERDALLVQRKGPACQCGDDDVCALAKERDALREHLKLVLEIPLGDLEPENDHWRGVVMQEARSALALSPDKGSGGGA